ncbi:MAG: TldD/PmbA family protein, partial [Candidatus Aegiribacteria sp.]|nr:TldD/PmbA family protein [Candidatus Aegiribacteria sp.]
MSSRKDITNYCIDAMLKAGIQKAQCTLSDKSKDEFNVDSGEISLLRTTNDTSLYMMGIIDDKKGSISINKTDTESLDRAVKEVLDLAESSEADSANDISEMQPSKVFQKGPIESNLNLMYDRITAFLKYSQKTYPSLMLEQAILDFVSKKSYFRNSNGVYFESSRGIYHFSPTFTSKEGAEISSFNYSGFSSGNLDRELHEYGSINTLMRQSTEQTSTKEISGKFTGEIIITPDCMNEFLSYITMFLSDYPLISGTSI